MPKRTISNLVFQGGSVKGAAYIGALSVLNEQINMKEVKRVAGASAGAITACLLALGCDMAQLTILLSEFDFKAVLDDGDNSYISTQNKLLKSVSKQERDNFLFFSKKGAKSVKLPIVYRLTQQKGIYEGEYIRNWVEQLIQNQVKTLSQGKYDGIHLTFSELHKLTEEYPGLFRDLAVMGANITLRQKTLFCYDNPETEHVIISDAIRISMSIPNLFKPHTIYRKIEGKRQVDMSENEWVDGGLYDNYPIECFDDKKYIETSSLLAAHDGRFYNSQTLGFRLVSRELKAYYEGLRQQPCENRPLSALAFHKAILNAREALQEERYGRAENKDRTIFIDHLNISALDFNLSKAQQQELIKSGKEATAAYFNRTTTPEDLVTTSNDSCRCL